MISTLFEGRPVRRRLAIRTPNGPEPPALVPLWLSYHELDLLTNLCMAAPISGGELERSLFVKLGDLLRKCL